MLKITEPEYVLMKSFIQEHCGIYLETGKEYLIESRLSDLAVENGCDSFQEFHLKARSDYTGKLKDRIIDAMTTNETLWFRDETAWMYIREVAVPEMVDKAEKQGSARIWSAAASTGQEAYSLLMLLDEEVKKRNKPHLLEKIEIFGTDISSSALFLAMSARYDSIAVSRGLPEDKKRKYFTQQGNIWMFDQELKKRVSFKKFNLQNSFMPLGVFDLVLCRYFSIYFSDTFKRELFAKIADVMNPGSALILGATESLRDYTNSFEVNYHKNAIINIKK